MIFDENTLRKINQLSLVTRQVRVGWMKGERRSTKRGSSVEFADYRNYTPGDDLRRLDWNIYARLDRPFLKLFQEEEDLVVHVLLDCSLSMDYGEVEFNKFQYGVKLAAAISSIALTNNDWLTVTAIKNMDEEEPQPVSSANQYGPTRGQFNTLNMLRFMESLTATGQTDISHSLRKFVSTARRPGLAFLISDLFTPGAYHDGLSLLQGRGYEVVIIHLLSPDEINPDLSGDFRLVDCETGFPQDVSVDEDMRLLYQRRLETWRSAIQEDCRKRGIRYLGISTQTPWDRVILKEMRQAGVVK